MNKNDNRNPKTNNATCKTQLSSEEKARRRKLIELADKAEPILKVVGVIALVLLIIWFLSTLIGGIGSDAGSNPGETQNPTTVTQPTTGETESTTAPTDAPNEETKPDETTKPSEEDNTEDVPRFITLDLNSTVKKLDAAPANYPQAWEMDKMNSIIVDGMKEAKAAKCNLAFCFKANTMFVNYDEETDSYSATFEFDGKVDEGEELKNCSIYKDENENVVVYGYTHDGLWFEKVTLNGKESTREVLTYDTNLPFFMKVESEKAVRIAEDYTLCVLANEFFAIYKDGQEVTIEKYTDESPIKEYDLSHGYFITKKGQIYTLSLSKAITTGEPLISYQFAGYIKENGRFDRFLVEVTEDGDPIVLPVFIDSDGKHQVLVPYKWEGFKEQSPVYADVIPDKAVAAKCHLIDLSMAQKVTEGYAEDDVIYSFYYKHFAEMKG